MEYTKLGRIRPVYKGTWNSSADYTTLDVVKSADSYRAYIAIKDVPKGTALTDATYWGAILDISDAADDYKSMFSPENLCDLKTLVRGELISRHNGAPVSHTYCGHVRVDLTDIDHLYVYNFRPDIFTGGDVGAVFDKDGGYIAGLYSGTASKKFDLTSSGYAQKAYALINLVLADTSLMITQKEYSGDLYIPHGTIYLRQGVQLYPTATAGKTLLIEGDSIAYGAGGNGVGIGELLAEKYGFALTNNAVSGSTLVSEEGRGCISDRMLANTDEYDYVVFDGGFNDYGLGKPIGALNTGEYPYSSTPTNDTVVGALECIFQHMLINHPRTQMFMFMPHHINRVWGQQLAGGTWEDYYNAIISVCARYGVPMIDISKDGRMCTNFAAIKAYTANSDGIHPTKEGYEIFYLPVFERALNLR